MIEYRKKKEVARKKDFGQKKTYRINIKLITEEYYSLIAKVKNTKTTISDFVRDCYPPPPQKKIMLRKAISVHPI